MKITNILDTVSSELIDTAKLVWPNADLLNYYNGAIRFVVSARPDSYITTEDFACVDGAFQQLPEGALRLVDVVFNKTSGRPITNIERSALDQRFDDWYNPILLTEDVEHFIYDDRSPREFYVYPAALSGTELRAKFSKIPVSTVIDDIDSDDLPIGEQYLDAITFYMMYRAYLKETKGQDIAKANSYLSTAQQLLGIKTQSDTQTSPNNKGQ